MELTYPLQRFIKALLKMKSFSPGGICYLHGGCIDICLIGMRFVPTHQDSSQKHHILHDVANTFACNKQVDTSKHIAKFGGKELYYRSVPLFMKVW